MKHPPPLHDLSSLDELIDHNVETVARIERATKMARSRSEIIADHISAYFGSVTFVWVHIIWFSTWILCNSLPWLPKSFHFDPPPFGELTLIVSLEAIFLSTFILISQNHQQKLADNRNHLDLQINLLSEQENSQMLAMLRDIIDHLGIDRESQTSTAMLEDIDPLNIVEKIKASDDEAAE